MVDTPIISSLNIVMTQTNNNLTEGAQLDAAHMDAAGANTAVAESLSLAELNQTLGKDFKDKATALKSLSDTQSYVGKKIAVVEPTPVVDQELKSKVNLLETQVFYANNPQFKGHEAIINAMGSVPAEVVGSEAFKTYLEKATVADNFTNSKSVVQSNARLSQEKTVLDEAVAVTNARGSTNEDSALVFARAINQQNNQG